MNEVTVFVDETAVTLPIHTQVAQAIRAYLSHRDPDLIKLLDRRELYAVDPVGCQVEEHCSLKHGMRIYVRKLQK
ncbi:hypothetical protein [Effusibacillus lacus]|uniref:Uncharacterized protein n=1 Tax=Effusibacillus lacus TaxID=1348429 RepID=A0A292YMC6_9BACL|nr:hypothetical protein [Effusibacillus lacus]TCS71393.1 hypothetical protein EDD64_12611 [Effusibacillus lacus]GAX89923.1 hypothetical protein EFBL_1549 [Effusibacillus lacus]